MARDPLVDEKDQIKAEADEAFDEGSMATDLMDEFHSEDTGLEGLAEEEEQLGEAIDEEEGKPTAGAEEEVEGDEVEEEDKGEPGVDRGDGRDATGKFVSKEQQDASDKAAADAKAAGKTPDEQKKAGDAAAAAAKPADAPKPSWEPFQIKADKSILPIDEAKISKVKAADGSEYMLISVAAKDFGRFSQRIGRGHALERRQREIVQRERELEIERNGPKLESEAEIEAKVMMEAIKPHLAALFTDEQLENLDLKVKLAQRDARDSYETARSKARDDAAGAEEWQKTQAEALVDQAFELVNHPELAGMTPEQIRDVLQDLDQSDRDKIIYRDGNEVYANTEYLFKQLRRGKSAAPAPAAPGNPSAPAKPDAAPDKNDRFNRGQQSAASPRSTSLKNGRTNTPPADRRRPREMARTAPEVDERQAAEDEYRKTVRNMNRSSTLDFDD